MSVTKRNFLLTMSAAVSAAVLPASRAQAQGTAFKQAIAEAAASDRDLAAFYKASGFSPIWTGTGRDDRKRREALLAALADAPAHGLPAARYQPERIVAGLRSVSSDRDRGALEVELSRVFLRYARDVQTGILTPSDIDELIARKVPLRARLSTLEAFSKSTPQAFLRSLPPDSPDYVRLMKEKRRFEEIIDRGGWGPEIRAAKSLKPGETGPAVLQLRNRLIAMGYMKRTAATGYDAALASAVKAFQADHGLFDDGVAGARTVTALNTSPQERLSQILVAMERERWINMPRGDRHIWVNLTDFHVRIVDHGKVTFITRSVVGQNVNDQRTPEFSDVMEHMVINPSWFVPRSITVKEYLPMLQADPDAIRHLDLIDQSGRIVSRQGLDFTAFDERTFPFDLKEPPSQGNALGLVKFMFPNRFNIYLHDTPAKSLFAREKRAFSHGCIRLQDPFDFAYALLARQTSDPVGFFKSQLATGNETYVDLREHVPVHIDYRTAFTEAKGRIQFREDFYGRDKKIWRALDNAGVALGGVQS